MSKELDIQTKDNPFSSPGGLVWSSPLIRRKILNLCDKGTEGRACVNWTLFTVVGFWYIEFDLSDGNRARVLEFDTFSGVTH